jgi:hypothetical protein
VIDIELHAKTQNQEDKFSVSRSWKYWKHSWKARGPQVFSKSTVVLPSWSSTFSVHYLRSHE